MIVYDLGKNIINVASSAVASIFELTPHQLNNPKNKKLKKSQTAPNMKSDFIYRIWDTQYKTVKKILTVHNEIKKEADVSFLGDEDQWKNRYELLEGELEIMFKELEDFAVKRYKIPTDTSIVGIKKRKAYWSIQLLEQNNLQAVENDQPTIH